MRELIEKQLPIDVHNANILLVDDEELNMEILAEILSSAGYRLFTCASSPYTAVELFEENDFDIVLLDLLMPGMDGFEVMERFKKVKKDVDTPVLMLTAVLDTKVRLKALSGGASDYLVKPFNGQEVISRTKNLLEMRLAQRRLKESNMILERKVDERTADLKQTQLEITNRLGMASECRDNETGFHIMRMSRFSMAIGKVIGMSDTNAEILLHAAPMHDIGKIGIPDSILLKPGKLDEDEFEIMKTHTTIGADILAGHDSDLLATAHLIALNHHEKWDGTGYPNRLAKKDIPLVGRIVAVADVFDALTSKRPYKEAWSDEKSVDYIKEGSGKQFDPEIVGAFITALQEIFKIKNSFIEPKKKGGQNDRR